MNHLCYLSIEHSHSPPVAVERKRREERERLVSFLEFYGDEFTLKLEIINENTTQVLSESRHFVRGPWTRAFVTSLFTSQQQTAWNTHRSRSKYPLWITRTFFTVVIYLTLLAVFGVEQRLVASPVRCVYRQASITWIPGQPWDWDFEILII